MQVYPASAPQSSASTNLVNHLRHDVLPPLEHSRAIKEFGFGLAAAVFLDALVVPCVLLPPCSNCSAHAPGGCPGG